MLTASELRKENLVETYYGSIVPIQPGGINAIEQKHPIAFFAPVFITEEWLLKFGFQRYKPNECLELITGTIDFRFEFENINILVEGQILPLHHIKYVHQFQNLYYAVTGEELIIAN